MNDAVIIGVRLHPFGRFDKTAMEMGADAIQSALTDAGVDWKDIQFGFGGSYEVSNPDAVTRLVGLTGITFANVFKRLRDCGYRHPADTGHHPARQVRHRHRHRSGTSTRVAHSPTIPRSSRCRRGTPRTVSSSPPNSSV